MGQKINPIGFRTGVTVGWKSRWYAPKSNFGEFLVEDTKIRKYLDDRLNRQPPFAGVSGIEIERTREEVKVIIQTARPGIVIGPKGAEVDNLKDALEDLTDRRVNINIVEVRNPDTNAQLVAEGIAEQLKRRSSFRRTMKQRAEATMQAGAKGVKIQLSGRLGGAEMSRCETTTLGSVPLHTLEADVDYGFLHCFTTYGSIGVKVWVYRGLFGEQKDEVPEPKGRGGGPRGRRQGRGPGGPGGGKRRVSAPSATTGATQTKAPAAPSAESTPQPPAENGGSASESSSTDSTES